ncbi:type II secretion system protein [Peribacillus alkalitolerans]|uniref:type II secretion system protein n=1 Tax=Peribacillus alkalitolerans TaxID=1550385 RepID=UPI0013D79F5C|nr:type II secretion system protein [Peribacillus alkalitolerans]
MKNMFREEKGLTLIELLISFAILGILITITSSALINSMNYSKKATSNVLLQQEANYILSELTNYHETTKKYTVEMDRNPKANFIKITDQNGVTNTISNPQFNYSITLIGTSSSQPLQFEVNQNAVNKILHIRLLIEDNQDSSNQFEVKTILSKM